jgi:hypothetical protein
MTRALLWAAAVVTAGCGTQAPTTGKAPQKPKAVEYFQVDLATAGAITGKVVFQGVKPARKVISMAADAGCQAANAGKPVYDEPVVTGKDGGLANAFVYIQAGLEDKNFEPPKEPVALDQHGCMFTPRVLGVSMGQGLVLKNSDLVTHNIHPLPVNNREWNQEQSPGAPEVQHRFARPEVMIPVKCNIHSWMHAYIGVLSHPYFAVTGTDGAFQLKNVPTGDYTVAVWHEKLGEQKQQVHIAASTPSAVNFSYK